MVLLELLLDGEALWSGVVELEELLEGFALCEAEELLLELDG